MKQTKYIAHILKFWKYRRGRSRNALRDRLAGILDITGRSVFLFENGRNAQYVFLKSLGLDSDSNIAVPGFTCNAVINPILWLNLKPLYIDISKETLNISLESLYDRIDENTKVVVIQHTFGNPVFQTKEEFQEFVNDMHSKDIIVFEDCAHVLGSKLEDQSLGTFGDVALFSFGIEKVLSTRIGGALIINDFKYLKDVKDIYDDLKIMGFLSTFFWLLNPLLWRILRYFNDSNRIAKLLNSMKILNMGFDEKELFGKMPRHYPRRLANVLSQVVLDEIETVDSIIDHRKGINNIYVQAFNTVGIIEGLNYFNWHDISALRYPILCDEQMREKLKLSLREQRIVVGDWYDPIIYPKGTNIASMGYEEGICPNAEEIAKKILNLPTGLYIDESFAKDIAQFIILFFKHHEGSRNQGEEHLE